MSAERTLLVGIFLLVLLACTSFLVGCGPSSEAEEGLQLTEEDAAILAEIEEILAGIKNGTVVLQDWGPQDEELPTDVDEFLDMMGYWSIDAAVTVYLKDSVETAPALYGEIRAMPEVLACSFVSKEQALARIKEWYADQPEIWEDLTSNPLPATFEVTLDSMSHLSAFVAELESHPEVDEVRDGSSGLTLADALSFLRMMTRDVSEVDRVYVLQVFGVDQCLGWNPLLNSGKPGPGPLRCFDSGAREVWSIELDGYGAEWVSGSPVKNAAAVLATKWVTPNDEQHAVLLVTSDPSISSGAEADKPIITVLRELPPPEDGFYSPQIAIARDGKSVGLYVMRSFFDSDRNFADESTLEVMDADGDTIWRVALPETSLSFPMVAFDQTLSTAALAMGDPITDDDLGFRRYVLVCRSPGRTERLESSTLGLSAEATMQEVSLSSDGKMLAIKSYGFAGYDDTVSLCSLEPEVELKWTVQSDCERPFFSADGRMLVCAYGGGSIRQVQVLSTTDGTILWEKTDRALGGDDLNESTGSSMWDFAPAFLWQSLSNPQSVLLVDLSGAEPTVKPLDQGVGFPMFFPGKGVIVGISEEGRVMTVPRP